MKRATAVTPVRRALWADSALQDLVEDGIGAVAVAHREYLEESIRSQFADSLDLDKALEKERAQENRWDYLLGHSASGHVVAVEPHSAKDGEIEVVIRKRSAACKQLRDHLRDGARIAAWLWVASGNVHFAATEKARRRLDQHGIEFVGKCVSQKHLPHALEPTARASRAKPRKRQGK